MTSLCFAAPEGMYERMIKIRLFSTSAGMLKPLLKGGYCVNVSDNWKRCSSRDDLFNSVMISAVSVLSVFETPSWWLAVQMWPRELSLADRSDCDTAMMPSGSSIYSGCSIISS